jgi:hypothetical protein
MTTRSYNPSSSLVRAMCTACAVTITAGMLLFVSALATPAWAAQGSPDPSQVPVLQALRTQVYALDRDVVLVTGIIEPEDLPILQKLADDLARMDAQFSIAASGESGGLMPSTLIQVLIGLRADVSLLRSHVAVAVTNASTNTTLAPVAKTLRFMQAVATALVARIDYALP